jgi:hypothetical protein
MIFIEIIDAKAAWRVSRSGICSSVGSIISIKLIPEKFP